MSCLFLPKNKLAGMLFFLIFGWLSYHFSFSFSLFHPSEKSDIFMHFNGFQSFFCVCGAFLGKFWGSLTFLIIKISQGHFSIEWLYQDSWRAVLPLLGLPTLAGMLYFSQPAKWTLGFSLGAFILFNLHPVGQQAWCYSLYWFIPILCYYFQDRFLFVRSLGATFSAHAVGSVIWLYCFSFTKDQWLSLIPVVVFERLVMALAISCVFMICYHSKSLLLPIAGTIRSFFKDPKLIG